ncbi:response regulator [Patescibacteria group bacterium]|nr:response regulator [Patescibacteria group bacterium]MDE1946294.1 response regulator [Patescibacteria group bacterium]MDE2010746.1 response regulator [Patescibacteria group bacterium]MDE2232630.1 response regulator [Patescibacteria group bacterium]
MANDIKSRKIADAQNTAQKILIITGDGAFGERLQRTLYDGGYSITLVKNGADALKVIIDTMPHLVLLDIVVPGTDGYGILAEKQAEPMLAKIPVFLMSAQGMPINIARLPHNSVTEFIVAIHADPNDIMKRIDRYFGRDRRQAKDLPKMITNGKKILWVEDDRLIGNILGKKFISSGFDLVHTKNGDETMEELEKFTPDALVVDLLLPGMSGFEILQKVKMDESLKKIPVMVLSNLSKPSDIEKARVLGAQKFLVKAAVSLDQIVSEVMSMCK